MKPSSGGWQILMMDYETVERIEGKNANGVGSPLLDRQQHVLWT